MLIFAHGVFAVKPIIVSGESLKVRMPYRLLRFGFSRKHPEPRMFTRHDSLKSGYDVVIIGGGGHGLAAAYYLARDHGIRNVAVLEKAISAAAIPAAIPRSSAPIT